MTNHIQSVIKTHVDEKELIDIRSSLQTGTPLGNDQFKQKVEAKLGLKVGLAKRGRPFKVVDKGC